MQRFARARWLECRSSFQPSYCHAPARRTRPACGVLHRSPASAGLRRLPCLPSGCKAGRRRSLPTHARGFVSDVTASTHACASRTREGCALQTAPMGRPSRPCMQQPWQAARLPFKPCWARAQTPHCQHWMAGMDAVAGHTEGGASRPTMLPATGLWCLHVSCSSCRQILYAAAQVEAAAAAGMLSRCSCIALHGVCAGLRHQ